MASFFNRTSGPLNAQILKQKYNNSVIWLYIISAFTIINILSVIFGASFYFLVSSSVPYVIVSLGMVFCGMLPDEEYAGELVNLRLFDKPVFAIFVIIALLIVGLYILSAIMAKKQKIGWLIFALVFFCLDTILMFLYFGFTIDIAIDAFFHIYLVVNLAIGISCYYKLKKIPPEEQSPETEQIFPVTSNENNDNLENSPILRSADFSVKSKTLLECTFLNHTIVYRRVKTVNELVIDGNVYAECNSKMLLTHSLFAVIDGHTIVAGLAANPPSFFITADNIILKQKIRWI